MATGLLNVAYGVYVGATLFSQVLSLRIGLVVSSALFIAYGIVDGSYSVILWNVAFGGASAIQIINLLRQRRSFDLDATEESAHDRVFGDLAIEDFVFLWEMGTRRIVTDVKLTIEGTEVEYLQLMLQGTATVTSGEQVVAELGTHDFIGEVSLTSGEPASATVTANGPIEIIEWSQDDIRGIGRVRPAVAASMWRALGHNSSIKLTR